MKTILIFCAVILGATLITAGDVPGDEYSTGQTLFRKNCEFCHILKGDDYYPSAYWRQFRPKDFTDPDSWKGLDAGKIGEVIKNGKGAMPPVRLTPEETKAIIDFMTHKLKN